MRDWAFVALGSNQGDRERYLSEARARMTALPHTRIEAESTVDETDPIGPVTQDRYLNQMVLLATGLEPRELLDRLLDIERDLGRVRRERWGPRTIDLDIVRFGDRVVRESGLTIPHPELPHRDFWQRELAQLLPHAR